MNRYVPSNSSGTLNLCDTRGMQLRKQPLALAQTLIFVAGPVGLSDPAGAEEVIRVGSAREMREAVSLPADALHWGGCGRPTGGRRTSLVKRSKRAPQKSPTAPLD